MPLQSPFDRAQVVSGPIASKKHGTELRMPCLLQLSLNRKNSFVFRTEGGSDLCRGKTRNVNCCGGLVVEGEFRLVKEIKGLPDLLLTESGVVPHVLDWKVVYADHVGVRTAHQVASQRDRGAVSLNSRWHISRPKTRGDCPVTAHE